MTDSTRPTFSLENGHSDRAAVCGLYCVGSEIGHPSGSLGDFSRINLPKICWEISPTITAHWEVASPSWCSTRINNTDKAVQAEGWEYISGSLRFTSRGFTGRIQLLNTPQKSVGYWGYSATRHAP